MQDTDILQFKQDSTAVKPLFMAIHALHMNREVKSTFLPTSPRLCIADCLLLSMVHGLQKSPPLRKGTRARTGGNSHVDNPPTELRADPGMVLNYKPQEQAAPAAAPPPPDLLDFDGLSMDGPPTGQSAAPAQVCIIGICNAFLVTVPALLVVSLQKVRH